MTKLEREEIKTLSRLSTALLDCWQYKKNDRAWQYSVDGGHVVPLAFGRGGIGEVCGALMLGLFLELLT